MTSDIRQIIIQTTFNTSVWEHNYSVSNYFIFNAAILSMYLNGLPIWQLLPSKSVTATELSLSTLFHAHIPCFIHFSQSSFTSLFLYSSTSFSPHTSYLFLLPSTTTKLSLLFIYFITNSSLTFFPSSPSRSSTGQFFILDISDIPTIS